jgi:type I restriction enzyme S subunit
MMESKLMPKLRFPEFSETWALKKLNSLVTPIKRNTRTPLEVMTISAGKGFITQKERFSQIIAGNSLEKYTHLKNNEFSYNRGNSKQFMYGCIYRLKNIEEALVPNVYRSFSFNNSIPGFYEQLFLKKYLDRQLRRLISSSARMDGLLNIGEKDFYKVKIPVTSLPEQQKIASFLTSVDSKIEKLEKKRELMGEYKRGVMQKIFSQEIRFRGEDGKEYPEWVEKCIGEIGTFFSGGTPESNKKKYYEGNIPFIGSGDISSDVVDKYITEEALNNSSSKLVEKGDLLYALYGATSGEVALSKISGAINQAILCIRSSENKTFLLNFLLHTKKKIINTYLQGGQGNLSAQIIKKIKINLPCLEEQEKIANFLSGIDKKIELVEQETEQVKEFKRGLLQQMFV